MIFDLNKYKMLQIQVHLIQKTILIIYTKDFLSDSGKEKNK